MNKKPDQIVAEKIISRLTENNLIPEDKKKEWMKRLSFETASYMEWNLLADFYIKKDKNGQRQN